MAFQKYVGGLIVSSYLVLRPLIIRIIENVMSSTKHNHISKVIAQSENPAEKKQKKQQNEQSLQNSIMHGISGIRKSRQFASLIKTSYNDPLYSNVFLTRMQPGFAISPLALVCLV